MVYAVYIHIYRYNNDNDNDDNAIGNVRVSIIVTFAIEINNNQHVINKQ